MRKTSGAMVALGGVMAAVAVVIMCLGTLIPLATYVCPMLCCVLAAMILHLCGKRMAWAWYGAVALLCLLLAPDKEAAMVFLFLGNYALLKPKMDKWPLRWLWKFLWFNLAVTALYALLIFLMGMQYLLVEAQALGVLGLAITLLLGNVTFVLLDFLLSRPLFRKKRK